MEAIIFRTQAQEEREKRDLAIWREYNELASIRGTSRTLINEHLMRKYGIHSAGTIYEIRRRVEKRIKEQGVDYETCK